MRKLVPRYILDRYLSGEQRGALRAAAIFVDLSGFSVMTDALARHGQAGAEVLTEVMRAVFEPLVETVYAQGGFVVGYAGDAFTAIFDEQPGRGPAAQRGLAAAIAMQEHVRAHPNVETSFGRFPIFIKAGVGFGEASWLILKNADGRRVTYCVRGASVDGSVDAEECARPGDVVLDSDSYALLKEFVAVEPAGDCFRVNEVRGGLPAPLPYSDPDPDPALLALFYPEGLIHQPVVGEFRQVVNMFIGIPYDPTDGAFVSPFMESIFALQDQYGGFFLRPDLDDKGFNILMFWGAPVAHENDVDRALNFLLDLAKWVDIPFKAGVTYKLAYSGFIGARSREDYTAYGWGVNLASRLMESAAPGEIRLDAEVAARAERHFTVRDLGGHAFKGFSGEVRVFALTGRKELTEIVYRGDLVGRETELAALARFVEPLREGKFAGVLIVNGDAGIGKSRLVHAFQASSANIVPAQWVICQTDEILRSPLNPFRDWLRARFLYSDSEPDAVNIQNFERQLRDVIDATPDSRLAMELDRTASVLAALLGLFQADSLYEQLDAKARYDNTLIALSALLQAESLRAPLILFLEDSQWLDEDTRAFLPYFVRTLLADPAKHYPIAVIASKRPEGILPNLDDAEYCRRLDLTQLGPADLGRIAETLLGGPVGPALIRLLEQRAEGNPFFAEQIVRYLSENELLALDEDGRYRVAAPAEESLPAEVRALLIARLDRLVRGVRETVQTASVLGREFELRLLVEMLRGDPDIMQKVSRAEDADIWFALDEVSYIFRHALLRDAAYSMQLLARQRELHALALNAIETLYGHELTDHYGALAYHAEKAGHERKARTYLTQAGKSASRAYQNHQAVDYFTRALALTPAEDLWAQFDLLIDRSELQRRLGSRDFQARDLDLLRELAERMNDEILIAHVLMLRSKFYFSGGEFQEAMECAAQAASVALSREDADDMLDAYNVWAVSLLRLGSPDEAMKKAAEGLRQARIAGRRHQEGSILNSMGMIAMEQREPASAQSYFEQALTIAREFHDRALETMVINNLGNMAGFVMGDYSASRTYYEQVHAIVREWGDRSAEGLVLANLGWAAGMQGDFEAAGAYHGQALSMAREVGNPYQETYTLINLSAVAGIQGDAVGALQSARRACDLARRTGDRAAEAWSLLYIGHAFLLSKEIEDAGGAFLACLQIRGELGQPGANMEPKAGLIEAALASNDLDSARNWTEEILAHLSDGGTLDGTEEPLRIYFACYQCLQRLKDPRSSAILRQAGQLLDSQVSKFQDEAARRLYVENVPWRRAIHQAWRSVQ
ncbi:MAG: AAA family ATPase [Chloroflexota bacterium]